MSRLPSISSETAWTVVLGVAAIGWIQMHVTFNPGGTHKDLLENFFYAEMYFVSGVDLLNSPAPASFAAPSFSPGEAWRQAQPFAWLLLATAVMGLASLLRAIRGSGHTRGPWRVGLLALALGIVGACWAQFQDFYTLKHLRSFWVASDRASTPWGGPTLLFSGLGLATLGILSTAFLRLLRRPGDRP